MTTNWTLEYLGKQVETHNAQGLPYPAIVDRRIDHEARKKKPIPDNGYEVKYYTKRSKGKIYPYAGRNRYRGKWSRCSDTDMANYL